MIWPIYMFILIKDKSTPINFGSYVVVHSARPKVLSSIRICNINYILNDAIAQSFSKSFNFLESPWDSIIFTKQPIELVKHNYFLLNPQLCTFYHERQRQNITRIEGSTQKLVPRKDLVVFSAYSSVSRFMLHKVSLSLWFRQQKYMYLYIWVETKKRWQTNKL